MNDMSTGNTITGVAKFFSSILTCVNLGLGISAALNIQNSYLYPTDPIQLFAQSSVSFPYFVVPVAVLICAFPTMILLDASPSHLVQLTIGSMIAYFLSSTASIYLGSTFGMWVSSCGVGAMSNVYGRATNYPAIELSLFSIIMLVPGSIGVKSVLANDTLTSVSFLFQMLQVALAIVTGLFTANILVPPLRIM